MNLEFRYLAWGETIQTSVCLFKENSVKQKDKALLSIDRHLGYFTS